MTKMSKSDKNTDGIIFTDSEKDLMSYIFTTGDDNKVDERVTIAEKNGGSIVLTPKEAIKMEKWSLKNRKTYLDGTPIFTSDEDYTENVKHETYSNRLDPMTKVVTFSDIEDPLELKIKASQYLLNSLKYPAEITASSADLHWIDVKWETFKLCQLVRVEFPGWKSDYKWENSYMSEQGKGLLRIEKMEIDIDKSVKKLTLGTPKRKELTEITRDIKEEAENKDRRTKVVSEKSYELLYAHDNEKLYFIPLNGDSQSDGD